MRARIAVAALATTMAVSTWSCGNAGEDRILSIEANGAAGGFVFFDRNGTRRYNLGDDPLPGVRVRLVALGTIDTVATATSDEDGIFRLGDVPVGRYRVVVETPSLGDSVGVVLVEDSEIEIGPADSVSVLAAVSYPIVSIAEARELPQGSRVFVEGVTLNAPTLFGDSTLHVMDTSAAIRTVRVARALTIAGDTVRMLGTVGERDGQPVLAEPEVIILGVSAEPPPEDISTFWASSARGGRLDAALVRILGAGISDTATAGDDFSVVVDDGTGPVEVLLDGDINFVTDSLFPGDTLDVTGLLVPSGSVWQLKPRARAEVVKKAP